MKKSLFALAALTAFAGVASAQSSVTLFGIIDAAATSIKNGSTTIKSLADSGNASSRLGFRGVEDLGGGMRAGFWLEGAIAADTGCGGSTVGAPSGATCPAQTWQRRSTVSLMGSFGEVRLGRDYTPTFWNISIFDPWATAGIANALNMRAAVGSGGATTSVRASNTIGYFLPAMGGVYGQVQVAAGEGTQGNKYVGGRLGYAAGPVNVAVAAGKTYKTGTAIDDVMTYNIGASFNAGFLTVQGHFDRTEYSAVEQDLAMVGVLVPVGSGTIKASYTKSSGKTGVAATNNTLDADQIAVGYVYDLSKRTAVYVQAARLDNDGSGTNGGTFRLNATNGGNNTNPPAGGNSTGYQVGIRHSF